MIPKLFALHYGISYFPTPNHESAVINRTFGHSPYFLKILLGVRPNGRCWGQQYEKVLAVEELTVFFQGGKALGLVPWLPSSVGAGGSLVRWLALAKGCHGKI